MLNSFLKSYLIGTAAYMMSGIWISFGSLEPTMKSNNIGYLLNLVGLLFWLTSFILYEKDRRKNG